MLPGRIFSIEATNGSFFVICQTPACSCQLSKEIHTYVLYILADKYYIFMYVYVCLFCLLLAELLIISFESKAEDKQERKDIHSAWKF